MDREPCAGRPRPSAIGGGCDLSSATVIRPALILWKDQLQNRGVWRMLHTAHSHRQDVVIPSGRADQELPPVTPRGTGAMGQRNGHPVGRKFQDVASSILAIPSLQPQAASRGDRHRVLSLGGRRFPTGKTGLHGGKHLGPTEDRRTPPYGRAPPGTQVKRSKVHESNPG
jgi:hypothetical protein